MIRLVKFPKKIRDKTSQKNPTSLIKKLRVGLIPASLCLHIPTSQVSSAQFIFPRPNVPRRGHFLLRSARQGLWAEPVEPVSWCCLAVAAVS